MMDSLEIQNESIEAEMEGNIHARWPQGRSQRSHNSVQYAISRIFGAAMLAYFRILRKTGGYCHRYITRAIHMTFSTTRVRQECSRKID